MATKRCRSRHQRHLRLLDKLYRLGCRVEACYGKTATAYGLGCYSMPDYDKRQDMFCPPSARIKGKHMFYPINERAEWMRSWTFAPPLKYAGHSLTFVVVPGIHLRDRRPQVILGWKQLSKYAGLIEQGTTK